MNALWDMKIHERVFLWSHYRISFFLYSRLHIYFQPLKLIRATTLFTVSYPKNYLAFIIGCLLPEIFMIDRTSCCDISYFNYNEVTKF